MQPLNYIKIKAFEPTVGTSVLYTVETTLIGKQSFDPTPNYGKYEELYLTSVDAKAHIDILTQMVLGKGFEFISDNQDTVEELKEFAKQSNLHETLERAILSMFVYGNGYIFLAEDENSEYPALQVINPKNVRIKTSQHGDIIAYEYDPSGIFAGDSTLRQPETVLDFAYNRIAGSVYGISLLQPVFEVLNHKNKITALLTTLAWRDSHRLLWAEVKISPDELKREVTVNGEPKTLAEVKIETVSNILSQRVKEVNGEVRIRNNFVFDDSVQLHDLTSSNDYRGLVEVLRFLQNLVDRALKVPKVFLGDPEGSNRATSYNQLRIFLMFVRSIQRKVEVEINRKLIPLIAENVEFRFKEPFEEDKTAIVDQVYKLANAGILTLGELREYIGYPREPPEQQNELEKQVEELKEYVAALERELEEYKKRDKNDNS